MHLGGDLLEPGVDELAALAGEDDDDRDVDLRWLGGRLLVLIRWIRRRRASVSSAGGGQYWQKSGGSRPAAEEPQFAQVAM